MTAPEPAPTGSLDELREIAMEQCSLVAFHAGMAADSGTVCADAGLYYNLRRAVAHIRVAIDVTKMMHERQQREARAADERRADHGLSGAERRGESI